MPEWPPRSPPTTRARRTPPAGSACRSRGSPIRLSTPPAQPTVKTPSVSESRFTRSRPVRKPGSRRLAPLRPVSSSTVKRSSSGGWSSASRSASAAARARPAPLSAPRVVPSARSQSPSHTSRSGSRVKSWGESGVFSQTMSRWAWSTTAGARSRPGEAGTRMRRLPAASRRLAQPRAAARRSNQRAACSSFPEQRGMRLISSKIRRTLPGSVMGVSLLAGFGRTTRRRTMRRLRPGRQAAGPKRHRGRR